MTRQNINQNLIRNNIIYAAYVSIRNSVICLLIIFGLAIYPYQTSMESCNNATLSDSEKEIMYSGEAVDWLVNNTQKEIDFDKIIEFYQKNCNDGMQKNMYDEEQKVIITIEFQNDKYFVSDIKSNIVEIN